MYTKIVFESKIVHEILCFTIEMAVRGCEGKGVWYGDCTYDRLWFYWEGKL